jgi:precorrin-6B methylase 2
MVLQSSVGGVIAGWREMRMPTRHGIKLVVFQSIPLRKGLDGLDIGAGGGASGEKVSRRCSVSETDWLR